MLTKFRKVRFSVRTEKTNYLRLGLDGMHCGRPMDIVKIDMLDLLISVQQPLAVLCTILKPAPIGFWISKNTKTNRVALCLSEKFSQPRCHTISWRIIFVPDAKRKFHYYQKCLFFIAAFTTDSSSLLTHT